MHNIIKIYPEAFTNKYLANRFDIEIFLFTQCNLQCGFCEVKHKHWEYNSNYFDEIQQELLHLIPVIDKKCTSGFVKLCGGEMFFDALVNTDAFKRYQQLIEFINTNIDISKTIQITSNLVHHNCQAIINLFRQFNNLKLNVLYDQYGRFTKQRQVDLWWSNIDRLIENNVFPSVNIIATKQLYNDVKQQTIDYIVKIAKRDLKINLLEYFGSDSNYTINQYAYSQLVASLYEMFPNNIVFNDLTVHQCANCAITNFEITPDFVSWDCCDKLASFKEFFKKNSCINCEYYNNCRISCGTNAFNGMCFDKLINNHVNKNTTYNSI